MSTNIYHRILLVFLTGLFIVLYLNVGFNNFIHLTTFTKQLLRQPECNLLTHNNGAETQFRPPRTPSNTDPNSTALFIHSVIFDITGNEFHIVGFKNCSDTCENVTIQFILKDNRISKHVLKTQYLNKPSCNPVCDLEGFAATGTINSAFTTGLAHSGLYLKCLDQIHVANIKSPCNENQYATTTQFKDVTLFGLNPNPQKHKFSICVRPMNNFVDWMALIQFIEVWKKAGCTKFIFYVSSVTPLVSSILQMYTSAGLVEIIPWSFQSKNSHQHAPFHIYLGGSQAAYNHCMLLSREISTYVGVVDFDELPMNLGIMTSVEQMFKKNDSLGCVYMNACLAKTSNISMESFDLNSSLKDIQQSTNCRTHKKIIRPRLTTLINDHYVKEFVNKSISGKKSLEKLVHLRRKHLFKLPNITRLTAYSAIDWNAGLNHRISTARCRILLSQSNQTVIDQMYAQKDNCWEKVYNGQQCNSVHLCDHVFDNFDQNFLYFDANWTVIV